MRFIGFVLWKNWYFIEGITFERIVVNRLPNHHFLHHDCVSILVFGNVGCPQALFFLGNDLRKDSQTAPARRIARIRTRIALSRLPYWSDAVTAIKILQSTPIQLETPFHLAQRSVVQMEITISD